MTFVESPGPYPFLHDPARAARTFETLADESIAIATPDRTLLESVFANSPYLARLALRDRDQLPSILRAPVAETVAQCCEQALAVATMENSADAMTQLRRAKRRAALAIALADIGGLWSVDDVTRALTTFADAAVRGALRFLLREAAQRAGLAKTDPTALEATTGMVVLAMGKYGAFELNYSSDIDIVVFYEASRFPFEKRGDPRPAAVDIVRGLVRLLSEVTGEGYVFRVDLRLRPDAGATQVAISTDAAESYYEGMGQNWERAAMIKARACAGDPQAGADFLKAIEPFIWRRNLDFAAIEDIHSIKRQIHAHEGHAQIAVAGHNIKLGRGGIREIEFFAQTQQLILGGRMPDLRAPTTFGALRALRARGLVTEATCADLIEAYRFLRRLEHRLQMIGDEQTHTMPKQDDDLANIANFAGYTDIDALGAALLQRLETVQDHYSHLFEREAPLDTQHGSLVFTGVEDDPETLNTLKGLNFRDPAHVAGAIRGWHHGRIRATRSARARELLTKLVPALLEALSKTADPDAAFAQFDRFITNLPAGVQLFSMLLARSEFLRLIAEIMGSAPRLAQHLARAPATLDALLDPGFLGELPSRRRLDRDFAAQMASVTDYEAALDTARRFAKEQIFRVGVQVIMGVAKADEAAPAFANIAECVVAGLLKAVEDELATTVGRMPGGAFAVIAMGKLGGREVTAASDLDLIFVYDAPADGETDGPKKIPAVVYYARLAQRFIAALTTATAAGTLYEVDMRLRPTGNKGPVAVGLESFIRYHESEAWTWEHLALTRARVICAPDALRAKIEPIVARALASRIDDAKLFADARDMRQRLAAEFPGKNRWDLKFAPGGLVDLEFIAQTFQLHAAPQKPEVLDTNTIAALKKLAAAGFLTDSDCNTLVAAAETQNALTQVLRIAVEGTLDPETASPGLKSLLVRADAASSFDELEHRLVSEQASVREIFTRVMAQK
ncbi:MAG TPA: bifunctional [glutamine synthetase] adenylyltransferase/[glutamine synthetase]-adenylyl-L-tyrosine phosphorylase [Rhizomicrobium sp.]|nr:bifunctional [glutamine synthetase] adenylyltransferase/[glutamine synthetase]-adenylyl-L-tyrosine phosphorylase [Rhizomicrobium sp.]